MSPLEKLVLVMILAFPLPNYEQTAAGNRLCHQEMPPQSPVATAVVKNFAAKI